MLVISYLFTIALGMKCVHRILVNDPERDSIWGKEKPLALRNEHTADKKE